MKARLNVLFALCTMLAVLPCTLAVDRYVSLAGGHAPPFANWADAATNIQSAIDAASVGDIIWVTNGTYASWGKAIAGDLTNRVALDKALTVQSVNGAAVTIVEGAWHPATTNGSSAVRCAWLTNGAVLSGFTLQRGATRSAGDVVTLQNGGGVWCVSTNATLKDCLITNSSAYNGGGGAYSGTLKYCTISGNTAGLWGGGVYLARLEHCEVTQNAALSRGGGAYQATLHNCKVNCNASQSGGGAASSTLKNCAVNGNSAVGGGGVMDCRLNNCTITGNMASNSGGGTSGGYLTNCIVYFNSAPSGTNYSGDVIRYSCATPLPYGVGNTNADPQLLPDGVHLANTSPCRGAGTISVASGTDIDGQPWANPPSMGCDEVWTAILSAIGFSDGGFTLEFPTHLGVSYAVDYMTNLTPPTVWETLQTLSSTGSLMRVTDTHATNDLRFYRVRVP